MDPADPESAADVAPMTEEQIAEAEHALQLQGDVSTMRTQELGEMLIAEVRRLKLALGDERERCVRLAEDAEADDLAGVRSAIIAALRG